MGSLDAPEIKEPESNQQLARHSTQLINLSRDQFGSIQKMNRQNLRNAGNRTGELQGRVAAGYTQAGGAGSDHELFDLRRLRINSNHLKPQSQKNSHFGIVSNV